MKPKALSNQTKTTVVNNDFRGADLKGATIINHIIIGSDEYTSDGLRGGISTIGQASQVIGETGTQSTSFIRVIIKTVLSGPVILVRWVFSFVKIKVVEVGVSDYILNNKEHLLKLLGENIHKLL